MKFSKPKPGYVEFEVSGGLGNQILCLAAALCYSKEMKVLCRLNLGRYFDAKGIRREHPGHSYRAFELSNFELASENGLVSISKSNLQYISRFHRAKKFRTDLQKVLGRFVRTYFVADGNLSIIPKSNRSSFLLWGNFLKFSHLELAKKFGLDELKLKIKSSEFSKFELMRDPNAIVVHIRFGDYLEAYPELIPGVNYYLTAIRKLIQFGALPKVVVFSDDSLLAKEFFSRLDFSEFEMQFPEITHHFSPSEVFTYIRESKFIVGSCSTFSGVAVILGSDNSVAVLPRKISDLFGFIEVPSREIILLESSN